MSKYWGKRTKRTKNKRDPDYKITSQTATPKEPEPSPDKKSGNKYEKIFSVVVVSICVVILIFMKFHEKSSYPKLVAFGWEEWSVRCESADRKYHLVSDINVNEEGLSGRHLKFLDEQGTALYYTPLFEKESLDKDGVWRFNYHKRDVRLFAKKDRSAVLKGDEQIFEISEDFRSLTVITKTGQNLSLVCKRQQ